MAFSSCFENYNVADPSVLNSSNFGGIASGKKSDVDAAKICEMTIGIPACVMNGVNPPD